MDKLKPIFVFLKRFHFWVLLGLAAVLGTFALNMAASQLCTEFDQRKGAISALASEMQNISTTAEHPNEEVIKGLQEQTEKLRQQVVRVWSELFEKQRKSVLKWPTGLTPAFLKVVENSKFGDDISPIDRREEYQEFVKKRLWELPEIIKAKTASKPDDSASGGPKPVRGKQPTRAAEDKDDEDSPQDYLVVWKGFENLERRFHWEDSPTPMRVWVAQEDLWVYETLLNIIARTNVNAKGAHNSSVSVINALEVGEDASSGSLTQGRVMRPPATGEAAPATEAPPADTPAAGVPTAKLSAADLALVNNRYLDTSGKPLPGDQRSQVAEYKRMPIRMALTMDPKEIPRLLVECANADLPVEVQQVRVNASARGGGASESSTETAASTRTADENSADHRKMHVPVIIQGIIYIFNPPDMTKLAPPEGEGQPAPAGAVPAAAAVPAASIPAAGAVPAVSVPAAAGATPVPGAASPAAVQHYSTASRREIAVCTRPIRVDHHL